MTDADLRCAHCTTREGRNESRDGKKYCEPCAIALGICEICGSIIEAGQSADDQLHYNELCFK